MFAIYENIMSSNVDIQWYITCAVEYFGEHPIDLAKGRLELVPSAVFTALFKNMKPVSKVLLTQNN